MSPKPRLLARVEQGDAAAREALLPIVYEELRRVARRLLSGELGGNVSLRTNDLVHEAYEQLLPDTNNSKWSGLKESTMTATPAPIADSQLVVNYYATELPRVGSTELWEIANTTEDAHPIHLHLIQFQIVNRQPLDAERYTADYEAAFGAGFSPGDGPPFPYNTRNSDGAVGGNLAFSSYLTDVPIPPADNEDGWKDTMLMPPGFVSRILVRFAPQAVPRNGVAAGQNMYPFDPTAVVGGPRDFAGNPGGGGYTTHCHILDHEDNEMMRPFAVMK